MFQNEQREECINKGWEPLDYIKQVVDFESVIFYVMERDKIIYCDAAGRLGSDSKLYESGSQRL